MGNVINKKDQDLGFYWSLILTDIMTFVINLLAFTMFVYFRKKLLVSSHNRILCSMSLADALVGVFGNNLGITLLLKKPSIYYKLLGNIPMFSSLFVSILSLVMLTGDRLIAMKKPYLYGSPFYKRLIVKLIIATWIFPALIIVQQSLIFVYKSSRQELIVRSVFFTVFFAIGILVLVISNVMLFIAIRRYARRLDSHSTNRQRANGESCSIDHSYTVYDTSKEDSAAAADKSGSSKVEFSVVCFNEKNNVNPAKNIENKKKKRKISRKQELKQTSLVCLLAVSLFIILWLPLAGYRFCYAAGIKSSIPWLRRLALCLTIANSFFNPVIYLLVKEEFRSYMKKLVYGVLLFKNCRE